MEAKPFIIQSYQDFLSAYVALQALCHAEPGATCKRVSTQEGVDVLFLPRYKVDDQEILDAIDRCDFSTQRVIVWMDLNVAAQAIDSHCYVGTIASLERMAKALPLQPNELQIREEVVTFEQFRNQQTAQANQLLQEAEALYRLSPNSSNWEVVKEAKLNLNQTKLTMREQERKMQEYHALSRSVREAQIQLGFNPQPDQTEKRIIMDAVEQARNQLEQSYRSP